MSQTRVEFVEVLLNKMRDEVAFGGPPRLSGLSPQEAMARWMASELTLYLNYAIGTRQWYPRHLQCQFQNDWERWRGTVGSPRGSFGYSVHRTTMAQGALSQLIIGGGANAGWFPRRVLGRIQRSDEEPDRVFIFTALHDRVELMENGEPWPGITPAGLSADMIRL